MTSLHAWVGRLRSLLGRRELDVRIEEEIDQHLALAAADFERSGLDPIEARRAALRAFGGVTQTKERYRDVSGLAWADALAQDLRYALRMARRQPGFSMAVIISVALGVGANTAMLSLVDAVLLRPLAYRDPDRLAVIRVVIPDFAASYPTLPANGLGFTLWREHVRAFETLSAIDPRIETLTGLGPPERVGTARVSANLFAALGAPIVHGRDFRPEEEQEGRDGVVIVSHAFWRARLGADPAALGRVLTLDGRPHVIVGVLGPDFRFPRGGQLGSLVTLAPHTTMFRPLAMSETERTSFGDFDYAVIGRLRDGATWTQAKAQLDAVQADFARRSGIPAHVESAVMPLHEQIVGDARRGLTILAAAVGSVLLLLCVNLANLLLARTGERQREAAVRTALGASRRRVLRQLDIENLLLAAIGGAAGFALASGLLTTLATQLPVDLPRFDEVRLGATAVGVAVLLTVITGLLFSFVPALRLSAAPPREALASGGRSMSAQDGSRLRSALVAGEVALSTVLLAVAGLLVVSFLKLLTVPAGFDSTGAVLATLVPSPALEDDDAARVAFFDRALAEVRVLPGVETAALVSFAPLRGEAHVHTLSREHDTRPITLRPAGNIRYISPDYFRALGIRLVRGRLFTDADRGRPVMVVNERLAATLWPGEDPIGKRLHQGDVDQPLQEVIGAIADTREVALQRTPVPMGYVPYWGRRVPSTATLVLRTPLDESMLAAPLRQALWRVDAGIPAPQIISLTDAVSQAVAPERFQATMVAVFAAGALLLAAVGIYGVPAYLVARRRQELGIRLALGASPRTLVSMVVRQGLVPVAAGLVLGLAGALAAGRAVSALLFEVSPSDPATLGVVVALLGAVAMVACYIPARRATRIDPVTALRME